MVIQDINCRICNKPLRLEHAVSDEKGNPVHEECYIREVDAKRKNQAPADKAIRKEGEPS